MKRQIAKAREAGDFVEVERLKRERRKMPSVDPCDPNFRRLRYVRYADDFLLGFAGPKSEADEIRQRLGAFLQEKLKLTLSPEKTLITHAHDGKAKFLGYEISVVREGTLIASNGYRATNGRIVLLMPRKVVDKYRSMYSKGGKVIHRPELMVDTDYTIIQRFQAVLAGVYNYYCMASNVGWRMHGIKWVLEVSLVKTLALKYRCSTTEIFRRYKDVGAEPTRLQVVVERKDKAPLVAIFGGIYFEKKPEGMVGTTDFSIQSAWFRPGCRRTEVVQRLLAGKCEICGKEGEPVEVHHIRKLADIDRPGRRPKTAWERIMSARKRKTLVTFDECHKAIHAGQHDGPKL